MARYARAVGNEETDCDNSSYAGLTRVSILLRRWIAGRSPAMNDFFG